MRAYSMINKNVDCEHMIHESRSCGHKDRNSGWSWWYPRCVEYKIDNITCNFKESLWDMLKKQNPQNNAGTNSKQKRPTPIKPPSKRYIREDVKWPHFSIDR